jgi:hypothetical protein
MMPVTERSCTKRSIRPPAPATIAALVGSALSQPVPGETSSWKRHPIKAILKFLLPFAVLLAVAAPAFAVGSFPVDAKTNLYIDAREPVPVQKAAQDLARDFRKVFGTSVRVVHRPDQASATTLWISDRFDLPKAVARPSGWERFHIQAVDHPWPGSPAVHAVVLTGSDTLGTIYAIYQFSQQFLGVDPLYWWTDHQPRRRSRVEIPDSYAETQGPTFRYRGFFINDEDLLTGWRPGIPDGADISLATWNRVYEAILRLKGNMVIPGTWIFPYEPQVKLAGERGLIVTQHHVNVLGLDTYQWPEKKEYSFLSAPQILEAAWKTSISQYPKGLHVVWSVGYRGHNDYPFWLVDPDAPKTAAGRAQVIQEAIEKEIEILKRAHPHAPIVLNAWAEAAGFIRSGLLKVPPGVTLVWPDDGHGAIQDGGEITKGEGIYYHTSMIDYRSNHFSELLPLETIRHELGRAARAGATDYLVVNTSNLRPVLMTSRATMELAWNANPWMAAQPDESVVYMRKWAREEFGAKAAPAVMKYYEAYFKAPAQYGRVPNQRMGDQFYEIFGRRILLQLSKDDLNSPMHMVGQPTFANVGAFAAFLEPRCRQADPRWQAALALARQAKGLVPAGRQQFFQANVLTQVEENLHGNRMLLDIAAATQTKSKAERIARMKAAIREGEMVERALRAADYGKWAGFYTKGDWLSDVPLTISLARSYLSQLEGHGQDLNAVIRAEDGGFAYHMITAYQGMQKIRFQR